MHYSQHWPFYLFILLPLVLTAKPSYKAKQCLRYRDNDIFAETCPAYSQGTVDFSAALFPDAAVISDLSKPNIIEKPVYNEPVHKEPDNGLEEPAKATNSLPSKKTNNDDTWQTHDTQDSRPHTTINDTKQQQDAASNNEKRKPLVSFEEWQKKIAQIENDKERRHKRKTVEDEGDGLPNKKQQMVDSIDGGFADDFGSMFEDLLGGVGGKDKKKPNVYAEGEYIAPSQSGPDSKNKKKQQFADVRMKSLKERFNYASTDCAATVRKVNKQAKGAQSILYESKDQYLLNKCSADKFVIINLCEEIVVDTIVMANFEFFSSTFKDFRVYASSKYPTKDWRLLGQWQARNTRDLQVFKVPYSGFLEYMKIEFLTHYGHEYYCPLSLVRVHGMPMLEFYNTVESKDQYPVLEEEHLWPAEVREQIIQPQFDVNDTAESFPVKMDLDEDDVKLIIPPINTAIETLTSFEPENTVPTQTDTALEVKAAKTIVKEPTENDMADKTAEEETGIAEITITQVISQTENSVPITPSDTLIDASNTTRSDTVPLSSSSPSSSSKKKTKVASDKGASSSSIKNPSSTSSNSVIAASNAVKSDIDNMSSENTDSSTDIASGQTSNEASTADNAEADSNTAQHHVDLTVSTTSSTTIVLPQSPLPAPQQPKPIPPIAHQKEGSTQESIYKTIMKRLNVLEVNMTLSQRFLDEQNKILNDVFMDMEKRHQDQLILLIGHLNETASYKIDSMKRRYEQWYEDLKDQTESDMREMTAKISILADQLSFERRVSVSQLVIMITLFVFMALSRGTFSTLSPVMAAQQEERKRRESIDQSSGLSKETLDILQRSSDNATDATVPSMPTPITEEPKLSIMRKLSELPKKPSNPRRHSDSPYHIMATASNDDGMSRKSSYESLGIEIHNELLHKRLDDLSQQQQQQQRPPLSNDTCRKSSLENLKESASIIKNRKRSSTSPPSSAIIP
ncbi:NAD(P)-bd_dom domain-containing protein [Mucor velutinosus]|uniref:NAD(P)-bd_dom domain-containing protein n=1 Tax=Mucor velutinosus TaxID=708070 RepID=A0AAN7DEB4_9FUNG|nr:NAD(P)-bd_dom domain-containing protein [Mucor velutinosus]